jgi:predicted metal-binding membrane protein
MTAAVSGRFRRLPTTGRVFRRRQGIPITTRRIEYVSWATIAASWGVLGVHTVAPVHVHDVHAEVAGWIPMTIAMMGPAAIPAIRHVCDSSLRWRRSRAAFEFVVVYLATWAAVGAAALSVASRLTPSRVTLAVALVVAAVWQLTPQKRRSLWNCHRAVPLPATGTRATLGCAHFALVHGRACVGSCWAVMATMAVVPGGHFLLAAALTPVVLHERRARRPRRASRQSAVVLGIASVFVAAPAL